MEETKQSTLRQKLLNRSRLKSLAITLGLSIISAALYLAYLVYIGIPQTQVHFSGL